MSVVFQTKGRLGNALFRYFGCSLFCLKYNLKYKTHGGYNSIIKDNTFIDWIEKDKQNIIPNINTNLNYLFNGYYQHDFFYRKYKKELLEYMKKNKDHYVLTDGINAGDGNIQKFYIKDIMNTPDNFNKYYEFALHIRLGDKVNHGITLTIDAIKNLLKKINIPNNSCIVVNKPKNDYEKNFINELVHYINNNKKFKINIENNNDILTDFHIMKNAETLVCSVSTISWCAALLSNKIKKCYMPDYPYKINTEGHCKKPIKNTELYDYI